MKKILSFLAVAALVVSCSKMDEAQPSSYIVTGYTAADTRVEFGTSSSFGNFNTMSFLWSAGDKIWVGSQQSDAIAEGGSSADFTLPNAPQDGAQIYYNMKATTSAKASTAVVPVEQDASKSMGENGAFGAATLNGNSFILEHQTNYLWFNVKALPSGATLKSIRLNAGDAIVAGSATWDAYSWGEVSNGSSVIDLKVNKTSVSDAKIAMVILPNEKFKTATITYELSISGETKYYEQTLSERTDPLAAGEIARISVDLSKVELYELRTLTFEGDYWTDLISLSDGEYGNGNGQYSWYDEDNTELMFEPNPNAAFSGYGGHAISNYTGSDLSQGDYTHDLQAYNVAGGANGSANFAVHFGYVDESGYGMQNEMVGIEFDDEVARVIESMYVTNTTYVYNLLENGDGWQVPTGAGDDSWFKVVAYGYDSLDATDDDYATSVEFTLWENGSGISDWTKWDLSGLGKVVKVRFNLVGSDDLYGDYGLGVAGYFAYDDVAVRF